MRALNPHAPRRILLRAVNWVGDAVMSLPALETLGAACPQAEITVLARPWVAPLYEAHPAVGEVVLYDRDAHRGLAGRRRLAGELKRRGFDWAVLFQNAFDAAFLAWLARVPVRLGYARDGRRLLLSHPVPCRPEVFAGHESAYYLHLLHGAGLAPAPPPEGVAPRLFLDPADRAWAGRWLEKQGLSGRRLLGLAPGAAFGPAKCWPAERFASAARELLAGEVEAVLLMGSAGEAPACGTVAGLLKCTPVFDLAGRTSLGRALALLERLALFICNDSGLMHAAAALGVPTLAVFGSTNPVATAPLGRWVRVIYHELDCAPCKKPRCPLGTLECLRSVAPEEVVEAARGLLSSAEERS